MAIILLVELNTKAKSAVCTKHEITLETILSMTFHSKFLDDNIYCLQLV